MFKSFHNPVFLIVCGSDSLAWLTQCPPSFQHTLRMGLVFICHVSPPLPSFHLSDVLHPGKDQGFWKAGWISTKIWKGSMISLALCFLIPKLKTVTDPNKVVLG